MINTFRDDWLEDFYDKDKSHRKIPKDIESRLSDKLVMLEVATVDLSLIKPYSNNFERLTGKLKAYCSIRVNKQYRLIFKWDSGTVGDVYLDKHEYKAR